MSFLSVVDSSVTTAAAQIGQLGNILDAAHSAAAQATSAVAPAAADEVSQAIAALFFVEWTRISAAVQHGRSLSRLLRIVIEVQPGSIFCSRKRCDSRTAGRFN